MHLSLKRGLSILLVVMLAMILVPAQEAEADWIGIELGVGRYTGDSIYVPGETMEILLKGSSGPLYDIWIVTPTGGESIHRTNVQIGGSGVATITYTVGDSVDDGNYFIKVTENGSFVDQVPYAVQAYDFNIETDQSAYLVGDEMRIFWTANYLKDRTLPPDGEVTIRILNATRDWDGNQWVINRTYLMDEQFYTSPAGSTAYTIKPNVDKNAIFWVDGWFNNTQGTRHQKARANFTVKLLGFSVNLDKSQYTLGKLMIIDISTFVTTNQSSLIPLAIEPGGELTIDFYDKSDYIQPIITIGPYTTDTHGKFQHILKLDDKNFSVNSEYELLIKVVKHDEALNSWIKIVDFTITEAAPVSLVLRMDSDRYSSGETLNVTAFATGPGPTTSFTYIYEVRDTNSTGSLFARDTRDNSSFSYDIDNDFVGSLWIHVTVDDGQGNREDAIELISVDYAIVLVNLDPPSYQAGDNITISYQVISTVMTEPNIFYTVADKFGSVVEEGIVNPDDESRMTGDFNFLVPAVPSKEYHFTVYASQRGTVVKGINSASLYEGYSLLIFFNKNVYSPGDTMAVDYEIIELGESIIPSNFTLTYGLTNGPQLTFQTQSPTGRLVYAIPLDLDEGSQLFIVNSDLGVQVSEVIVIKNNPNPFWHARIFDMPLLTFLLLIIVLFCFVTVMRMRKVVNEMKYQKLVETPKRSSEVAKSTAGGSSSTVTCDECEKPIEVTTTRRPIELMCPHCGEIQRLED